MRTLIVFLAVSFLTCPAFPQQHDGAPKPQAPVKKRSTRSGKPGAKAARPAPKPPTAPGAPFPGQIAQSQTYMPDTGETASRSSGEALPTEEPKPMALATMTNQDVFSSATAAAGASAHRSVWTPPPPSSGSFSSRSRGEDADEWFRQEAKRRRDFEEQHPHVESGPVGAPFGDVSRMTPSQYRQFKQDKIQAENNRKAREAYSRGQAESQARFEEEARKRGVSPGTIREQQKKK